MLKKLKVLFASDHVYNGLACVLGALAGLWAATTPRVLDEETTVLLAAAGAAVGLLAVVLTAMTLVIAFLDDFFGEVIEVAGTRRFFMPFVVVAFVSAADAVVAFAGALDSGGEPAPPTSVDLEPSRMSESDLYGQETFCLESRPGCLFGLSVVRAAWSGSLSDTR
jgi:hypothetical protein